MPQTIAVNSSEGPQSKTFTRAGSRAVKYEVLGGILCLRTDATINLFPIFENKVQLGGFSPRAALTSARAREDK